jgi:predicted DNA-binding transcriptional regulator YafY
MLMSDTTQIERQLYILSLLSESKNGCTIDDIMSYLNRLGIEVSQKTVSRDLDALSMVNFPVYEEERNKKTYYIAKKFGLENVSFTLNELISIYFIKEILNSYSALEIGENASQLIDRLISHLPQINRDYINSLNELVKVNPAEVLREKRIDPGMLNQIRDAIAFRKRLLITYNSFNKEEQTERCIDPYFLEINEGCYHLVCYCNLRKNKRVFRVSRIISLKVLDETFEKQKDFYEEYQRSKFDKLSGEKQINLRLRFSGMAAKFVQEYESEKADRIAPLENNVILFEKQTTMTPEILKWVLGYGSSVQVIEPEELREQVRKEAEGILRNCMQL